MRLIALLTTLALPLAAQIPVAIIGGNSAVASTPFTISQTNTNFTADFGCSSGYMKRAQSFTLGSPSHVTSVKLYLYKVGAPTDNITVDIYSNNTVGPKPNSLVASTTTTVSGSSLSTSTTGAEFTFNFSPVSLAAGKWWIAAGRSSGTADTSNCYYLRAATNGTYTGNGLSSIGMSPPWVAESETDLKFVLSGVTP